MKAGRNKARCLTHRNLCGFGQKFNQPLLVRRLNCEHVDQGDHTAFLGNLGHAVFLACKHPLQATRSGLGRGLIARGTLHPSVSRSDNSRSSTAAPNDAADQSCNDGQGLALAFSAGSRRQQAPLSPSCVEVPPVNVCRIALPKRGTPPQPRVAMAQPLPGASRWRGDECSTYAGKSFDLAVFGSTCIECTTQCLCRQMFFWSNWL